ncbi:MAG: glycoside hydrolase family 13 domain protein [Deltaproteobacteria bacterium]|nr:glycoside hydrolase family 13 domain protein [Deltaproteobacteria bacterium]
MVEKKVKAKASSKSAGAKTAKGTKTKTVNKAPAAKAAPKSAKKKTTFKLQAPEAAEVFVAGCFNEWDPTADPLQRGEEGVWACTLMLEPGEHEYRFVVDGVWWDDPVNSIRRQNDLGCENCIIIV